MGEITAETSARTKSAADADAPSSIRRRRPTVAALRRDRRGGGEDDARAVPDWGRIVFRSGSVTLR